MASPSKAQMGGIHIGIPGHHPQFVGTGSPPPPENTVTYLGNTVTYLGTNVTYLGE